MMIWNKDVYVSPSKREWIIILISISMLVLSIWALMEAHTTSNLTKTQIDLIYQEIKPNVILKEKINCPGMLNYRKFDSIKLVNLGSLSTRYTLFLEGKHLFFQYTPTLAKFKDFEDF